MAKKLLYLAPDPDNPCASDFWINPNIQISGGMFTVDQPATISLIVHNAGIIDTTNNSPSFDPVRVDGAQAVVCALNTHPGFDPRLILPSLQKSGPLVWTNKPDDRTYDLDNGQSTEPPAHPNIVLPSWTPTANDVAFFTHFPGAAFGLPPFFYPPGDMSIRDLHVCVYANCNGHVLSGDGKLSKDNKDGDPLGTISDWDNALAGGSSSFCTHIQHGQLSTTLARTLNKNALGAVFYSGVPRLSKGGDGDMSTAKVFLREQVFEPQADQGLVEMIRRAGLNGLPIQPALVPARVAGIARFRSVAERIEQKAEEIVDEAREALEHLHGHWADEDDERDPGSPRNVLTLELAPGDLQPLLMKVAFDKDDPLGTVHVFDVIQLNQDGTRGGFRLATIHTPAE